MEKLFLLMLLAPLATVAQTQNAFFEKYSGKDGFTTVSISPKLFQLVASADLDDDATAMIQDLTGLNVLVFENEDGKNADKAAELVKEAYATIGSGYDELMSVKESGTDIKILARSVGDGIVNDLLIVGEDDGEFVYVDLAGKIDVKKISHLSDDIDIKGLDELKKLDDTDDKK